MSVIISILANAPNHDNRGCRAIEGVRRGRSGRLVQRITSGSLAFSDSVSGALTRDAGEDVGTYTINQGTLTIADGNSGNNYAITYVSDDFTIAALGITITADAGQTKVYGDADPVLSSTITSGALQGGDTLTGALDRVAGEDVGNYTITQGTLTVDDGNGGANYSITYESDDFAITARPLTLTADAGQTKVYGDGDPAFTASITSGSLAFTDTLTGAQSRAVGEDVGSYALAQGTLAVSDGNSGNNYAITYVSDNFDINQRPITITADAGQSKVFGAADPVFSSTITSGSLAFSDTTTGALDRVVGEDVGTYTINQGTLTIADGNGGANYAVTYVSDDFTITALGITITADAGQTKVYGDTDPIFTSSITSGSLQGGDTLTGALGRVVGEDVGNYTITQGTLTVDDGNGGANYSITYESDDFAITARPLTLTADPGQTKVYGDGDPAFTASITSGSLAFTDTLSGAQTRAAGEDVSSYSLAQGTLAVSDGNSGNNYAITYISDNFDITARPITITADAGQSKVFGAVDPALTSTLTSGSLAFSDSVSGALTRDAGEDVGIYTLNQGTLTIADGNGGNNYAITYVSDDFTIAALGLTITADAGQTKVYGDSDPVFSSTITSGSLQGGDTLTGALDRVTGEDVGTYTITQGTLTVADGNGGANYSISYVSDDFAITARPLTLTADVGQTKVYGDVDPAFTASITSGSLAFTDTLSGAQSRAAGEDVGSYALAQGTLSVSDGNSGNNYALTYVSDNFDITQRPITIIADPQSKLFGETDPALTSTITSGSLAFTDSLTGALSRAAGEDVGNYPISQGTLTVSDGNAGLNYNVTFVSNNFTIGQFAITITADAGQSKVYGDTDPIFTSTLTSGTLQGGDALTGSLDRVVGENVGSYTITQGSLTVADGNGGANYSITYVSDDFAITARPLTLTADAGQTKVYGDSDPVFSSTITSGSLQGGDTLMGALARVVGEDVGTYTITQGSLSVADGNGGANYSISYVSDDFAITARPLTLTADAGQTKVYGDVDPALTASITSGSLAFTDTLSGAQSRAAGEDVGSYALAQGSLAVSDGNSGNNYVLTYVSDNFDITQRPITITADAGQSKVFGAVDPALTSMLTSGSLAFSDSVSGALTRDAGEDVGMYTINQGTLTIADGNSGNNYAITYVSDDFTIAALGHHDHGGCRADQGLWRHRSDL